MKRLLITSFLTLLIGGAGLWGYVLWKTRAATHISATGGRPLFIHLPITPPHFLQSDPLWAKEKIGGSAETIRGVGCAMCSVASAAKFLGEDTNPLTFNRALIANGGYTDQGWLVWSAVSKVFGKRVEAIMTNSPSHESMDRALEKGQYPIIKFILPIGIPHWVVVVGKEGQDYLIHDPLVSTVEPLHLSERTSAIYSVRIVKAGS